jgi:hypothetical protein
MHQVGGLAAGGAVLDVPLVDLVWLPPRNPDDDEDVPRLPTLEGWFKVKPDGEEVEGFPEGIEINISIILSKIILDEDEIKDANVIDVCVRITPFAKACRVLSLVMSRAPSSHLCSVAKQLLEDTDTKVPLLPTQPPYLCRLAVNHLSLIFVTKKLISLH